MTILKETKSKFAIRQAVQGTPYFNILETRGLAKGYWNDEIGKGYILRSN